MNYTTNRVESAMQWASGLEPMTAKELREPRSEYVDPVTGPVQIVPGLFVAGTHLFDPCGEATQEVPAVDHTRFDAVITLTDNARPVGDAAEEIKLPVQHGWQGPIEIMELNALIDEIYPRWASGEDIIIRSYYGVNRAPMVAALVLVKAGVETSIAVQLIRTVHTEYAFYDDEALSFLLRDSEHVIDPNWQVQEYAENLLEMERMEQALDAPDLTLDELEALREQMRLLRRPMSKGMGANQEMLDRLSALMHRVSARIENHD